MSIRITARPARGIRRAGRHHPAEPVVFPDGFFAGDEMEILRRDPDLIVEEGEFENAMADSDRPLRLMNRPRNGASGAQAGTGAAGSPDAGDSGKSNSGAERPDAPAAASGGDVTETASQQPADVAGDRTGEATRDALEATAMRELLDRIAELTETALATPVAQLESLVMTITDVRVVRAIQERDTRKSAQAIYDEWIDQLTPGASRQGD